jgi:hypothetical protein
MKENQVCYKEIKYKTVGNLILLDAKKVNEFITMWNSAYKIGIIKKMSKYFNVSDCTICRIRKKLKLKNLNDLDHPAKKKMLKYIRDRYCRDEFSSVKISNNNKYKISDEMIRIYLRKIGKKIRKSDCNNSLYFSTRNNKITNKLIKEIRTDYIYNKMTIKDLAIKYKMSYEAMSNKLKQMKVKKEYGNRIKSDNICLWCGKELKYVNISKGTRTQKYCSSVCKHRAVDYRRHIKGVKVSEVGYKNKDNFLREVWCEKYQEIRDKIVNVKPIIQKTKEAIRC